MNGSNDTPTPPDVTRSAPAYTAAHDASADLSTLSLHDALPICQTATLSYALDTGETGVGAYGTLTVDAAGHYTYVANASAINALHDGVSDRVGRAEVWTAVTVGSRMPTAT